jgi:hypothetical protein
MRRVARRRKRDGRRSLVPDVIALLAILALIFAASHYLLKRSTSTLFLGSTDARVTACTLPFPSLSTTVELTNPTGRTANLGTDVEFDDPRRSPERVGLTYVEVDHVPGGQARATTQSDLPDGPVAPETLSSSHLTCKIVAPSSESSPTR